MPTIREQLGGDPTQWFHLFEMETQTLDEMRPTVLDINNVWDYQRAHHRSLANLIHLPLTPPWGHTWVEYRDREVRASYASLIARADFPTGTLVEGEEIRWSLLWSPFVREDRDLVIHHASQFVTYLTPTGEPLLGELQNGKPTIRVYATAPYRDEEEATLFLALISAMSQHLSLVTFAFALLNCKNVLIEDQAVPPKLAAKRLKKHGVPSVTKKVLRVVPLAQAHRHPGETVPLDHSPRALHIRRGYFGDYREGRGLFGKFHGVYWWDQAIRGSRSAGEVVKSYELEQPEGVR